MRNFNEQTITDAVLERISGARDPRVQQISEALVRHLHAFVREVRPTQREWEYGIDFLTRTGHMCDDKRQEFILLSDTLGVSMLVDAINHAISEGATETTVLGPFFVQAAPDKQNGDDISGGMEGDPMLVTGSVSTVDGLASIAIRLLEMNGVLDRHRHLRGDLLEQLDLRGRKCIVFLAGDVERAVLAA